MDFIFNQYYLSLLKKLKNSAKSNRPDKQASKVYRVIKINYATFDKLSDSYRNTFYETMKGFFEGFVVTDDAVTSDVFNTLEFFKGIEFQDVKKLVKPNVLYQYLIIFGIILNDKNILEALELCKKFDVDKLASIEDEVLKNYLTRLSVYSANDTNANPSENATEQPDSKTQSLMDDLNKTSLGRLATELLGEIDVKEVTDSIGLNKEPTLNEDGTPAAPKMPDMSNIFASLSNNSGGLGKLFATVGNKFQEKMASGELSQETILKDAMSLASKLPGLMGGGANNGGGLGDIGKMLNALQGMGLGGLGGMGNNVKPKPNRRKR